MGWAAGERNLVFYVDDRWIELTDYIWVQDALTVTVAIFKRLGFETNTEKQSHWYALLAKFGGSGAKMCTNNRK